MRVSHRNQYTTAYDVENLTSSWFKYLGSLSKLDLI